MPPRFIQLHWLTSYPAALLNRDDAGFAKRITFGGAVRTRVSSQCQKRHWRTFDGEWSLRELNAPETIRSRLTFQRFVLQPLLDDGIDAALARTVVQALMGQVLGKSAKAKKQKTSTDADAKADVNTPLRTEQVTVLGRPEIDFLLSEAREICQEAGGPKKAAEITKARLGKDGKLNLQAMGLAAGLDAALFGRMVTSDRLASRDAAVHVEHAFTVHRGEFEDDYFSAVDDLIQGEGLGSGHIDTMELTSGLFYGYAVVAVPLLVSNLEGIEHERWQEADRVLAGRIVEHLIHLVATVSPGAKLGSTAPYSYAHMVAVEAGDAQPRTLANAFLRPVGYHSDLLCATYQALGNYVRALDVMYGRNTERRLSAIESNGLADALGAGNVLGLDQLAAWTRDRIMA